jgi:hypothetical protein
MKINMKKLALAAIAASAVFAPEAAHAFSTGMSATGSGTDLAGQITQMANQSSGTPALIAWGGYVIGTFFVAVGIFKLKAHSDNAAQNKLGPALGLLFTGAAFLVMPSAAKLFITSSNMTGGVDAYNNTAFQ